MKAIIKQELVKAAWSGRTVIPVTIIGTKENIMEKVNNYISERLIKENYIKVKCFHVNIYTHKGKKVNSWNYIPTYR